ncbi:hypothetical protein PFMC_06056, partial [Plasmodium falciparum CAMP/Malaysia]
MVRQVYNTVNDYTIASDVKHLFDIIGKDVYETVKKVAEQYRSQLKGTLSKAKFEKAPNGQQTPGNTCELKYQWHTNVTNGRSYPCRTGTEKRFSEVSGGECDKNKIRGSKGDNEGACAPYRRLHLCDYNLENINDYKNINNHTLLADVCLAALHEGDSIKGYHDKYKETNDSSQLCTMLARSFADIGDIVRGKDLYLRDKGKRDKLENNLKEIFKKIHSEVTSSGSNGQTLQARYQDTENYYQLREDWWYANRETVWKAIRCSAPTDADYFIKTVCSKGTTSTQGKCRCIDFSVPTYFDYVPQYLRWFEEWAEEFCRLRKHKLQNAIKNCRYPKDEHKYCDLNGFDCTKTASGRNKFAPDSDCHECSFSCTPFTNWIDNQKEEFEKQKKKYAEEINGNNQISKDTSHGKINNIYINDFYKILYEYYPKVENFLEKLNKEGICKKPSKVGNETADSVDFTKEDVGEIFSRTKYCRACPLCGLQSVRPPWDPKKDTDCKHIGIKTFDENKSTEIELLVKDKAGQTMMQKLKSLCNTPSNPTTQKWKCHYVGPGEDYCVLQDGNQGKPERTVKQYEAFFNLWIHEMLDDSIKWRTEHSQCINNKKGSNCIGGCKKPCECFAKWIEQKKKEWKFMEKHFDQQEDLQGSFRNIILKEYLSEFFKEKIKQAYGEDDSKELMQKINKIDMSQKIGNTQDSEDAIKILLAHEKDEAEKCLKTRKDPCPSIDTRARGRSETSHNDPQPPPAGPVNDVDDDDEDHHDDITPRDLNIEVDDLDRKDPEDQVKEPAETEEEKQEVGSATEKEGPPSPTVDKVKPACKIVEELFTNGEPKDIFKDACEQKYAKNNSRLGWKCIPTGNTSNEGAATDSKSGRRIAKRSAETSGPTSDKSDATSGSICIPPRRRKLYTQKLHDWAKNYNTGATGTTQVSGQATVNGVSKNPKVELLKAFVESAAVETFFLWDRYKKIKLKEKLEEQARQNGLPLGTGGSGDGDSNDPQNKLASGTIPPEFLRQMFYTLGDYRDILEGKNIVVDMLSASSGSDKQMQEKEDNIKKAIEKIFQNSGEQQTSGSTQQTEREKWWDKHAPSIWHGMICALTYKENEDKNTSEGTNKIKKDDDVYKKFFGTPNGNPPLPFTAATQKGTYESKYKYTEAKLEEKNSGASPKTTQPPSTSDNTPLTQFVLRPPYFRYLEEWGQNFCKERKKRLEKIKDDCKVDEDDYKCSGDGEQCDRRDTSNGLFAELDKPSCATPCRLYKKWIERKRTEYEKQKSAYEQQKEQCKKESNNHYNGFYGTLKSLSDAAEFLQKLGPCKNENGEDKKGDLYIKFDEDKSFKHTEYCDSCSEFIVKCENGVCSGGGKKVNCNGKNKNSITAKDIGNGGNSAEDIGMLVSDNSGNGFNGDLSDCKDADIFKGFRKDVWTCRNVCGLDVCGLKKGDNNGELDDKQIILVRALIKRWLETFFEDYNRIQKKLNLCIENGKGCKCIKGCVEKWLQEKRTEWNNIRKLYVDNYEKKNEHGNNLNSFLEQEPFKNEVDKAIGPCPSLNAFERSIHCNGTANSGNSEESTKYDGVLCLLDRLKTKVTACPGKPSVENQAQTCEKSTHVEDGDEPLEEDEQNTVGKQHPPFCKIDEPPEPVDEGHCKTDAPQHDVKEEEEEKEEEKDKETLASGEGEGEEPSALAPTEPTEASEENPKEVPQEPESPKKEVTKKEKSPKRPPKPPRVKPPQPYLPPALKNAMLSSTIMWSVGISFAAISYFLLKVNG